jgi:hypothetical protein
MYKLDKLFAAQTPADMVSISLAEFLKVSPHSFTKSKVDSDGAEHILDVGINTIHSANSMLVVTVDCKLDGQELFINNPLYFQNPLLLVPDGTFETINDPELGEQTVPNMHEDATEAMRGMLFSVINSTALQDTSWVR